MTGNRTTRALRAAVFTALAVPLAALGQVVITGRALPLTLVAAASAAVFVLAVALSGTRRGFLQISAVLVPVELLLNTAFNLGQETCAAQTHGVNLLVCGGGSLGGSPLSQLAGHSGTALQLLVLLVHLALALAAAAWLDRGDAALALVVDAASALQTLLSAPLRALRLLAPLPASPAALVPVREAETLTPLEDVVLSPAPRRGPPALALAA